MPMQTSSEIGVGCNYKFTHIPADALAQMLFDRFENPSDTRKLDLYRRRVARPDQTWKQMIVTVIGESLRLKKYGARVSEYHNIVPLVLRESFAMLISGTTVTPTFKANYIALGSGSASASNANTKLQTETIRGLFTSRSATSNIATLDKFFAATEVGGNTYNEAGIFVDGSGSADTGYLLSRVVINETMGATETLTINATFTIS